METASAKSAFRERMRSVRRAIPPDDRIRLAGLLADNLFSLPEVSGAATVLVFYSFGSEVPTAPIVDRLLAEGQRVLFPYLSEEGMDAAEIRGREDVVATTYGPKEPARRSAVDPGEVDVVIAPGLAFDRRGRRLGYGGGHYDRYLKRLPPETLRVGIGFAGQLVDEVPAEPSDERVDLVVTDEAVTDCRGTGGPSV